MVFAAQGSAESGAFINVVVILACVGLAIATMWARRIAQKLSEPVPRFGALAISILAGFFAGLFVWNGIESTAPFSNTFYWIAGGLAVGVSTAVTVFTMLRRT